MNIPLIATTVVSALSPFFQKAGEKIAEVFGEEIYPKIKRLFIIPEEELALKKYQEQPNDRKHEKKVRDILIAKLSEEDNKQTLIEITNSLNLTNSKAFIIERTVEQIENIKDDIDFYKEGQRGAGVGTQGDWSGQLMLKERLLQDLEKKLLKQLNG